MNSKELTKEQLIFLQETLNTARAEWFNKYEDSHTDYHLNEKTCLNNYHMAKELRTLFYQMGERDTLAYDDHYHEQRLDQRHDR